MVVMTHEGGDVHEVSQTVSELTTNEAMLFEPVVDESAAIGLLKARRDAGSFSSWTSLSLSAGCLCSLATGTGTAAKMPQDSLDYYSPVRPDVFQVIHGLRSLSLLYVST